MFQVFLGLTPFIGITLIGYLLGYIKIFDLQKAGIFNLFSFYIAVPALIIKLVAQSDVGEIDVSQISSYFLMQLTSGIFAFLLTKHTFKRTDENESHECQEGNHMGKGIGEWPPFPIHSDWEQ